MSNSWPIVLHYGGGDNSRALGIALVEKKIRPDLILFADTGGELPTTYANNLEFSAWLVSQGYPEITVVSDGRRTLESEVLEARTLPSVAFGFKSCSDKYKIRPQDRYIKQWQPAIEAWKAGGKVIKFIGYDANEKHRQKDYDDARFIVRYPLAEWGWDRRACSDLVKKRGFTPSKSSCFFCPNSKPKEVLALAKNNPELFARAVAMEENATAVTTVKGLGRSWSWAGLVKADTEQMRMFEDASDAMPCGCYDGGSQPENTKDAA